MTKPQSASAQTRHAVRTNSGFAASSVPRNDDGSTSSAIPLGFTVNFFGATFNSAFVNNNGNITFGGPLSDFTPEGLIASPLRIIAPFWADVDTRAPGSALVTYGQDTVDGRPAFGANYVNVGYFSSHDDKLNSFQLVLIDRSDVAPGDFDIEFNYDRIVWETGEASGGTNGLGGVSASAGYSNGSRTAEGSFEILGSRRPGIFLDSNRNALVRRTLNSNVRGRLVFFVRSGAVGCTYSVLLTDLEFPWPGGTSAIQVSAPFDCEWTATSSAGFVSLAAGSGRGSGSVDFTVSPNRRSTPRSATLTVAGQSIVITQEAFITLRVTPSPLVVSSVDGAFPSRVAFQVESLSGPVEWTASAGLLNGEGWRFTVAPHSGTVTETQPVTLILELNPGLLPPSPAAAAITVRDNTNGTSVVVPVTLNVGSPGGRLQLSQSVFVFRAPEGGSSPAPQSLQIFNSGEGSLPWSLLASTLSSAPWLNFSSLAGTALAGSSPPSTTTLSVNPVGLAPGVYQVLAPVSAPGAANDPQLVSVTLQVVPAETSSAADASPKGMVFIAQQGRAAPAAQKLNISNLGGGELTFQLNPSTISGGEWLGVSPTSGSAGLVSATAQVTANSAGLTPGFYSGRIAATFSDGKTQVVQVLLVVSAEERRTFLGPSVCSPHGMELVAATVGDGASLAVSFPSPVLARVVDTCGGAVNNATVLFVIGKTAIPLEPAGNGSYRGIWTPGEDASSGSVGFAVLHPTYGILQRSYNVSIAAAPGEANLPTILTDGVVDAATFTPRQPLAPGGMISIFGSNLAPEEAFASRVPLERELAGVRVRIGGEDAPLYYVGPTQINAQVPFTARPGDTVAVAIVVNSGGQLSAPQNYLISPVQPAIFQSEGVAAALDGRSRPISGQNPARIGDTLQIFATGLGLVEPAVETGAAAPPTSTVRNRVRATIGGVEVPVAYQGLAPGSVGLYQVNVTVPSGITPGDDVPIVLRQNGIPSNLNFQVTIPVRLP